MKSSRQIWIRVGIVLAVGLLITGIIWAYKRSKKNAVPTTGGIAEANTVTKPKPVEQEAVQNTSQATISRDRTLLTP